MQHSKSDEEVYEQATFYFEPTFYSKHFSRSVTGDERF